MEIKPWMLTCETLVQTAAMLVMRYMKVSEELKELQCGRHSPFSQLRGVAACQVTETQGPDVQEILQDGAGLYPSSPLPLHPSL